MITVPMISIPTSAKKTLMCMLRERWYKIPWYNYDEKNNVIIIAESYGLTDLINEFNETYEN